jgi:crossover junction endodeoxyribonuclease RuvC
VIEKNHGTRLLAYNTIEISGASSRRLYALQKAIEELIEKYNPEYVGIEKLFFSVNKTTALSVAEARGVILAAFEKHDLKIFQYAPTEIKSTISGWGKSDKKTMQKCVALSLGLKSLEGYDDAADALAIALRTSFEVH